MRERTKVSEVCAWMIDYIWEKIKHDHKSWLEARVGTFRSYNLKINKNCLLKTSTIYKFIES